MVRAALLALLALAAVNARAQSPTLADAPACREALNALDARATQRAPKPELEMLRRRAAAVCLGAGSASPPAARAHAPQAVAPIAARPAAIAVPQPVPRPLAPPAAPLTPPAAPLTLGACDATGCWASDGTRLSRAGANQLLGPRGLCSVQGTLIHCPP
jgi:hypothetical protein